ncbi:MAG TPA: hypothetical protein VGD55_04545 [Acidothermaceae bacterium]
MTRRTGLVVSGAVVVIGLLAAAVVVGRATAPVRDRGFANGDAAGYAEGVAVGRALQIGDSVPKGSAAATTAAFQAGYRAGETDAYGSYDGGWKLGAPYVVVLASGLGGAPYRIIDRDQLILGTTYRLCPDGTSICHS